MAFGAKERGPARSSRDDAADASRFFSRVGYAALAIGAPVAVVVHPLALFIVFPIGVAMIVMAAALEGKPGIVGRGMRAFTTPTFIALVAGLAWATLSVLWTPYPVSALQHALKIGLLILATLWRSPRRAKTRAPPTSISSRSASSWAWWSWRPGAWPASPTMSRTTTAWLPAGSRWRCFCFRRWGA